MPAMACHTRAVRFAFYGRTARTDTADTEAELLWQQHCCRAAAAAHGGQITTWFFDTSCPADMPLASRPQGRALLAALAGPRRPIGAVVATDLARLLPRQAAPDTSVPGWPAAWSTAFTTLASSLPCWASWRTMLAASSAPRAARWGLGSRLL